jgi:hypothetical protein
MHPEYHHSPPQPQYQPLPSVSTFMSADGYVNGGNGALFFDTTGQFAPPGMRPRLTTSVSEEEGSLCFQVDVNGICVARREGLSFYHCRSCVCLQSAITWTGPQRPCDSSKLLSRCCSLFAAFPLTRCHSLWRHTFSFG